jgi:hypothetical protein
MEVVAMTLGDWIVVDLLAMIGATALWIRHRRTVRQSVESWRGRSPMSDREFLRRCQVPDESVKIDVALAVRRAIAELGTVTAETILPDDRLFEDLGQLPFWDSLDWLHFILTTERQLGVKMRSPGSSVFGDAIIRQAGGYGAEIRVEHIVRAVVAVVCCPKKAVLDEEW